MEFMAALYDMAVFSFWLITELSIFVVVSLVMLVSTSELIKITCEPRWLIELKRDRKPLGGPYRVAPDQPDYIYVNFWMLFGITLGELYEKADIMRLSSTVKLQERFEAVWNCAPLRRALNYGLTAAFLGLVFNGSAYLFGETPSVNETLSFGASPAYIIDLPFALSSMWDVPALFIGVTLLFGGIYLINSRISCKNGEFSLGVIAVLLALFAAGVCSVLNFHFIVTTPSSFGLVLLFTLAFVAAAISLPNGCICIVAVAISDIAQAVGRFAGSDKLNPLTVKVNGDNAGLIAFTGVLAAGLMAGVTNWGVAPGLVLGLAVGLVVAVAVTSLVYMLTLIGRLMVVVVKICRLHIVLDAFKAFWS